MISHWPSPLASWLTKFREALETKL